MKAVIFDLDGTLANTLPLCVAAFRKAIEPLAGRALTDEQIIATFGPSEEGTINQLIPEHYAEGVERYLIHYRDLHGMCPAPFEGVAPMLEWLRAKGVPIGLVTGKGRRSCEISLERFGLASCFDAVETGSPHGQVKTEGIQAVLERLGVDPSQAIYVGDSPSDITSAARAGVAPVAAAWAPTADAAQLEALGPHRLFRSIPDFTAYLQTSIG